MLVLRVNNVTDFFYRTEDISPKDVTKYFVETAIDRTIIDSLKSRAPIVMVGSRGVGKSFLLRVAEQELLQHFDNDRVFPVYVSFVRSSLIRSEDPEKFQRWMLARLCSAVIRALERRGLLGAIPRSIKLIAGSDVGAKIEKTRIEEIAEQYESSYREPKANVAGDELPTIEDFRDAVEDLSEDLGVSRFVFLIDEAAHIFLPEQQRQFFTLFRDLRSHCLVCKAAVYPGVTSYGDTFQPTHDASVLEIDRDVMTSGYVDHMREIVQKQADASTQRNVLKNGQNFAILAYAASGNPRLLLKTLAEAPKVASTEVNEAIRKFYRSNIWTEHTDLADKYTGHKAIIDWGRLFIEESVLPAIKARNDSALSDDRDTSAFFWVHRNAPATVKEALRILSYTGIVKEGESGIRATRSEVGRRYSVNLGCLFALEPTPTRTAFGIAHSLSVKRMTEYGSNHGIYEPIAKMALSEIDAEDGFDLAPHLSKGIEVLDLTDWQKEKLKELTLASVGKVLEASEEDLKLAKYVGDIRARRMRNAAVASVLEYLSG